MQSILAFLAMSAILGSRAASRRRIPRLALFGLCLMVAVALSSRRMI